MCTKLPEAENGEKSSSANMSSKEEKKSVFDNKLLKKIIVKIVRNPHRQSDAVLQRAILNPATITPVRRPDEGNCPIFDRKELLEFKNNQHSSEEEPATRVVTESKKRISGGTTPRNRSKRRSRSRTRSRSTSSRRSCSSFRFDSSFLYSEYFAF
nr:putative transformer protein-B [Oncopeltus fasciatus]